MVILINLLWVLSNSAVVSAVSCTCLSCIGHDKEIVLITADHYDEILFRFSSLCHSQKSASSGLFGCGGFSRNKLFQQIMRVLHILCVEYMVTYSACNMRRPIISNLWKAAEWHFSKTSYNSYNNFTPHIEQTLFIDIVYLNVSKVNGIQFPQLFWKLMQLCQTWHAHVTSDWFMFLKL